MKYWFILLSIIFVPAHNIDVIVRQNSNTTKVLIKPYRVFGKSGGFILNNYFTYVLDMYIKYGGLCIDSSLKSKPDSKNANIEILTGKLCHMDILFQQSHTQQHPRSMK